MLSPLFSKALASWLAYTVLLNAQLSRRFDVMCLIASERPDKPDDPQQPQLRLPAARARLAAARATATEGEAALGACLARAERRPGRIVDGAGARLAWHRVLADGGLWEAPGTPPKFLAGEYQFAFRDYVNAEERLAMLSSRLALTWLLLRQPAPTKLEVRADGRCVIKDRMVTLGVVPLACEWRGTLDGHRIDWTTTSARVGWRWLGRTIDRPAKAEELRAAPWLVRRAVEASVEAAGTGEITSEAAGEARAGRGLRPLRFNRLGEGCLVFEPVVARARRRLLPRALAALIAKVPRRGPPHARDAYEYFAA